MELYLQLPRRLLTRFRSRRKTERGSVTIEACISVVTFMFVMLALLYLINVSRAQMLIQTAINKSALEISEYMYLYKVTGLYDMDVAIQKEGTKAEKTVGNIGEKVGGIADGLSALSSGIQKGSGQIAEDIGNGDLPGLIKTVNQTVENNGNVIEELKTNATALTGILKGIKNDPVQFLRQIAAFGVSSMANEAKSFLFSLFAQALTEEMLDTPDVSADERLKSLGVVDGLDGLDFSRTTILDVHARSANKEQDINIVVIYKIELMPYLRVNFSRTFAQSASVRCWLGGDRT